VADSRQKQHLMSATATQDERRLKQNNCLS